MQDEEPEIDKTIEATHLEDSTPNSSEKKTTFVNHFDSLGQIDRYAILRKLGSGAFGAVYMALDEEAGIDVAVKALPTMVTSDQEEMEKIRKNFALVSRLSHQNIAKLRHLHKISEFDIQAEKELGIGEGDYLVVMDLIDGKTLSSYRSKKEGKKLSLEEAIKFCKHVGDALDYAHSEKILHRDIKPSNIMVTDNRNIKILDFGLAAEIRSSMSRISRDGTTISGTMPYMAPEQWQGKRQDARTDQYALGVMFYELATGHVPFSGAFETNNSAVIANVVETKMPEYIDELSDKQNKCLLKALAKLPSDRYDSCSEFIEAMNSSTVLLTSPSQTEHPPEKINLILIKICAAFMFLIVFLVGVYFIAGQFKDNHENEPPQDNSNTSQTLHIISKNISTTNHKILNELLQKSQTLLTELQFQKVAIMLSKMKKIDANNSHVLKIEEILKTKASLKDAAKAKGKAVVAMENIKSLTGNIKAFRGGATIKKLRDEIQSKLITAESLFTEKSYGLALIEFSEVVQECERLKQLNIDRRNADKIIYRTGHLRRYSTKFKKQYRPFWENADKEFQAANKAFKKGEFQKAKQLAEKAKIAFSKMYYSLLIEKEKEKFQKASIPVILELEQKNSLLWQAVNAKQEEANKLFFEKKYEESRNTWKEVNKLLLKAIKDSIAPLK